VAGEVVTEPERTAIIRAPVAGRLTRRALGLAGAGHAVAAGAALGQVSDARPLVAPIAGVVTRVGARPGEIVSEGQDPARARRPEPSGGPARLAGAGAPPRVVGLAPDTASRVEPTSSDRRPRRTR
jgi:hypothetical protein